MNLRKKLFFLPLVLLGLIACTEQEPVVSVQNSTANPEDVDRNKVWLATTEATYAPFEFRDEHGNVIGFDPDLIRAIAKDQGVEVQILPRQWDGIFDTLNDDSRDLIAAAITVTPKRQADYLLSDPYMTFSNIAIYKNEDLEINSFNDLSKLKVSFLSGSSFGDEVKKITNSPDNLMPADTQYLAFKAMMNGTADVTIGPAPVLLYYANNNSQHGPFKNYKYTPAGAADKQIAFVFKKGNEALAKKVNEGLKNVRANGTYDLIYKKWLGDTE